MGVYDDAVFQAAYDKVMAKWPADREAMTVATRFGATYVNVCGPRDAPPLLLLPGAGERPPPPGTPRWPTWPGSGGCTPWT